MDVIFLNCLLMDNNEIIFNGRSLGFISDSEVAKYAYEKNADEKLVKLLSDQEGK